LKEAGSSGCLSPVEYLQGILELNPIWLQGDQMRFEKSCHKVAHSTFCETEDITFTVKKASQLCVLFLYLIFTKIPTVVSHPMGENSPNLVTLFDFHE
jgi:hypothetical protein